MSTRVITAAAMTAKATKTTVQHHTAQQSINANCSDGNIKGSADKARAVKVICESESDG